MDFTKIPAELILCINQLCFYFFSHCVLVCYKFLLLHVINAARIAFSC